MSIDGERAVRSWMRDRGITHIVAVSPHLDDAAFSLAHLLTVPDFPARRVHTVFTAARKDSDARHSLAMGFADPLQEFEARRREDQQAMARMGVAYTHGGLEVDRFDAEAIRGTVTRLLDDARSDGADPRGVLCLLPAGAGGVLGTWQRAWRRLRRLPAGCQPHAEHEWVRDGLLKPLAAAGAHVGLYAEVPYLWGESVDALQRRLPASPDGDWGAVLVPPNASFKLDVAACYRSQIESEFGHRRSFQLRTIGVPEVVFLPSK